MHTQASNISVLHPVPRSHSFTFTQLLKWPREVIKLPFCHLEAGLIFKPGFLPIWQAPLPSLVLVPHWVALCVWGPHPYLPGGWVSPPDQTVHWCLAGSLLPVVWGMDPGNKEGKKTTISTVQDEPPDTLWETWTEIQDTEAIQQEATFYCASTDSADLCPKAEPQEQRGVTLYTLVNRWQKQKARFNLYMVTHNFIGYFPLVLCDPLQI
jgi:hypothetical protein